MPGGRTKGLLEAISCEAFMSWVLVPDHAAPFLQGYPICCPTFTSFTSLHCWCTERPETSTSACESMAVPGRSTASVCLTESYPMSTEADPSKQFYSAWMLKGVCLKQEGATAPRRKLFFPIE